MEIRVTLKQAKEIGLRDLREWFAEKQWEGWDARRVDLADHDRASAERLRSLLEKNASVRGVKTLIKDVERWLSALDGKDVRPRTVRQFYSLLYRYLRHVPGHVLFERRSEEGVYVGYYVNDIKYWERQVHRDSTTPEHVVVELCYTTLDGQHRDTESFYPEDCVGTVAEILARKNYYAATPDLLAEYEREVEAYGNVFGKIGLQMWAIGTGTDNLDGTGSHDSRGSTVQLVREGRPARVVVDETYEDDTTSRRERSRVYVHTWLWKKTAADDEDASVDLYEAEEVRLPIHPYVPVFDMARHLRLRVHVTNLRPYEYDRTLADKLVLPGEIRDLVSTLVEHREGGFQDVVRDKSGGAIVLLAGPPGVGKTLTAEAYAESTEKPLYSVQCSQLGIAPSALEESLMVVFRRARRWNAVLLLDEADVYVRERGTDLAQNAIVGVFLRVLEYQKSLLFLTTNRPDLVDDAIASRCVARIVYPSPTEDEQLRIWRVLASENSVELADPERIVGENPGISGRDVKNLLKLVLLTKKGEKTPVTAAEVAFVRRFAPTIALKHGSPRVRSADLTLEDGGHANEWSTPNKRG